MNRIDGLHPWSVVCVQVPIDGDLLADGDGLSAAEQVSRCFFRRNGCGWGHGDRDDDGDCSDGAGRSNL